MKSFLKNIAGKYFASFSYFYFHLRYRIFIMLFTSVLVGVLDGFGLAMFLPMLEMVSDQGGTATSEKMGNLSFILDGIIYLGLELTLTVVLLIIFFFFLLKGCVKLLEAYLKVVYQQYFVRKIRIDSIQGLSQFHFKKFITADAGRIQNTLSGEVGRVSNAYNSYILVIQQLVMVLVYTFLAFLANPQFAALVATGGVLSNFIFNIVYKKTKSLSRKLTRSSHGFQGILIQQVAFFKYLKATGMITDYANRLIRKVYEIEHSQRKIGVLKGIMEGAREPLLMGIVVTVILVQVKVLGGSLGLIILSILFFYRALTSVMQLQTAYNRFLEMHGSMDNLTKFTRELNEGKEQMGSKQYEHFNREICLNDIGFSYGETDILHHIRLQIRKNETIAFVGESGSGKTTLMNMLCGLFQPTEGEILIDGSNIQELDIRTFRKRIGYITQEPVIFNDTIYNNVTFWDDENDSNRQRFKDALDKASILEFVERQPEKGKTLLGSNGINLSGGQKQRISIARELYKEVDLLFMDEATSALDSETELTIQENIDRLKGKYTIIIIAHRLSTIKNADRVVVLNKGKIDQIGNYQDLILRSDSFKRMVELQEL